ncbi:hypothetical protein M3202_05760 [Alkalihalobacillus oceani]|uniref:Amidohydrolase-related domain-containing protein n=1 Tax=Halalkalibacter oceani TaxID=1653776 RepID=A0A9X2DNU4_9BACI|nr:hypothetical protein [Halalkalibacter oceani]MCM3713582.1 hypothetical protein [Halalkalibacter oceani]
MYLLDRAVHLHEDSLQSRSYLIENGQVRYVTGNFKKWKQKRSVLEGIALEPGRVMVANRLLDAANFTSFREQQATFIEKGCTTVIVLPKADYERQLEAVMKRAKHSLASSTLDYVIGLSIPLSLLRCSVVRRCQKMKIPLLQIKLTSCRDIQQLPWSHIAQTLMSYPILLIPSVSEGAADQQMLLEVWEQCCDSYHIHTAPPLIEEAPWSKSLLQKSGLYPEKGVLLHGSDADYLLFSPKDRGGTVASKGGFVYHDNNPSVVVIRGQIIKENQMIVGKPGYGRYLQIKRPGRFLAIEDAT